MVILDLDGTTVPHLYDIGNYTVKVFKKLNEQGHKVVISTGRPFRSSFFAYHKMSLDTPIINYNGSLITNPINPNYENYSFTMDNKNILKIYNHVKDLCEVFFAEASDNIYSSVDLKEAYDLMHVNSLSTLYIGDLNEIFREGAHGCMALAKKDCGNKIIDYINSNFDNLKARLWSWGPYKEIVEIYSTERNKGTAIKKVMKDLGFKKDDVICCGDSINDLEIFNESGYRISPSNADPRLKEYADLILDGDCESEALADYFNERFNLEVER